MAGVKWLANSSAQQNICLRRLDIRLRVGSLKTEHSYSQFVLISLRLKKVFPLKSRWYFPCKIFEELPWENKEGKLPFLLICSQNRFNLFLLKTSQWNENKEFCCRLYKLSKLMTCTSHLLQDIASLILCQQNRLVFSIQTYLCEKSNIQPQSLSQKLWAFHPFILPTDTILTHPLTKQVHDVNIRKQITVLMFKSVEHLFFLVRQMPYETITVGGEGKGK